MKNKANDVHNKSLKEEIMNEITEIVMGNLKDTVKQKVQDELNQYQDSTNKKLEKKRKQLNELIERTSTNSEVKQRTPQKKRYMN
jgi:hypothetical protein